MAFDLNDLSNFGDFNAFVSRLWGTVVGWVKDFFGWVHAWPLWAKVLMWFLIVLVTYLVALWLSDNWEEWKARY